VGTPSGTTNIQIILDLCPCVLKHVVGCRYHRVPYAGFQLLKVVVIDLVDEVLHITPEKNIQ
jgi:hypothetical protein